jgi:membrane-bound acyltransferase YfiQ involved in biofilm formation
VRGKGFLFWDGKGWHVDEAEDLLLFCFLFIGGFGSILVTFLFLDLVFICQKPYWISLFVLREIKAVQC